MSTEETPLLELRDLSRHYAMGEYVVHALDRISLQVRPGEFLMVVGSSGSGKSTLMQILGCLDVPTAGGYVLRGEDVTRLPDVPLSRIRNRHIGFVFQQYNLLPNLTVLENIALPLAYRGIRRSHRFAAARRYAEMLGLQDRLHHRPSQLSGGQSQRVAIARALVTEPDILLADEPTGNLDSHTGLEIMRLLAELNEQGKTIIMVTHEADIAAFARKCLHMKDGRVERVE